MYPLDLSLNHTRALCRLCNQCRWKVPSFLLCSCVSRDEPNASSETYWDLSSIQSNRIVSGPCESLHGSPSCKQADSTGAARV